MITIELFRWCCWSSGPPLGTIHSNRVRVSMCCQNNVVVVCLDECIAETVLYYTMHASTTKFTHQIRGRLYVRTADNIVPFTHTLLCAALRFFPCWMQLVATSCSCAALYRAALRFIELRCFLLVILHKSYHSFTHELRCASKNTIRVFTIWVN